MKDTCHTHKSAMSRRCTRHVAQMNEPCRTYECVSYTGWQGLIECLKLQVIFCKRATNYRAPLQKMTSKEKASYGSLPPWMNASLIHVDVMSLEVIFCKGALWLVALLQKMRCHVEHDIWGTKNLYVRHEIWDTTLLCHVAHMNVSLRWMRHVAHRNASCLSDDWQSYWIHMCNMA